MDTNTTTGETAGTTTTKAPSPATTGAPAAAPGLTVSRGLMQTSGRGNDPEGTTYEDMPSGAVKVTLPSGVIQVRAPQTAGFLSKGEITRAQDLTYEDVEVPEWGGWARIYGLTAGERGKIEAAQVRIKGDGEQVWDGSRLRELFVGYALRDPNTGVRMFADKELHVLSAKSAAALDRLYEVAIRLARVSKKDIEELSGNSDSDLSADSAGGTANG